MSNHAAIRTFYGPKEPYLSGHALVSRFKVLPKWVKKILFVLPIAFIFEVYLLVNLIGSAEGSIAELPGLPPEELQVTSQQVEVMIDDTFASHERKVSFYEKIRIAIKDGSKASGYWMVVPASYQLPYEITKQVPLSYQLSGNGRINGYDTLPEIAPPIRGLYSFLSLQTGKEVPIKSLPEENVFEVKYEIKNFPLLDEKSGREFFFWSFPSPSRPIDVDQAKLLLVLPSYAKSEEVNLITRRVQYGVTEDGFADFTRASVSTATSLTEGEEGIKTGKTSGIIGSKKRVQLMISAEKLNAFETIEVLVRW